jgi:hypothetical protein
MDSTILVALVDKNYEQRVREYEFYQNLQDQMVFNPGHFVLPENQLTAH